MNRFLGGGALFCPEPPSGRDRIEILCGAEGLTRVIEAVMDTGQANPPTLGGVQAAMEEGVVARMVGEGTIEQDEDDTLTGEMEELIRRYGPDVQAERFSATNSRFQASPPSCQGALARSPLRPLAPLPEDYLGKAP